MDAAVRVSAVEVRACTGVGTRCVEFVAIGRLRRRIEKLGSSAHRSRREAPLRCLPSSERDRLRSKLQLHDAFCVAESHNSAPAGIGYLALQRSVEISHSD